MVRGRRRDGNINDSVSEGGRGGMALVVGVKEEANVGRAGGRGGRNEVFGLIGNRVAGGDETSEGGKFTADGAKGVADGVAGRSFVEAAGKKVVAKGVHGEVAETAKGRGKKGREKRETEAAEEAKLIVGVGQAVVGVLTRKIVEGNGHHRIGKGRKVGTDMSGSRERGREMVKGLLLEAAVDIPTEVGKADGAVSEMGKGGRVIGGGKVRAK